MHSLPLRATVNRIIAVTLIALPATAMAGPADFSLRNDTQTFQLSKARGKFIALHFLLKTECPYCLRYTQEYRDRASEVAGIVHLFLKPDSEAEIKSWMSKLSHGDRPVALFRDANATLADSFKIPGGYEFHGITTHYPALVLLGPDGNEVFRYVGKNNADRLSFDKFAAKVATLSRTPAIDAYNLSESNPAIQGFDTVAYVASGRAEKGKKEIASHYRGVIYQFANGENRERFAADPEKYLPEYGGWCATAMADGRKVDIDPTNFKVTTGRLFLFYKGWLGNAIKDWNADEAALTTKADAAWKSIAPKDGPLAKEKP